MFGYVRPRRDLLSPEDFEAYRAAYCGLCRALGKQYVFLGMSVFAATMGETALTVLFILMTAVVVGMTVLSYVKTQQGR